MDPGTETVRHCYVHVPFCPQICPFCSFHVLRRTPGAVGAYLDRLDRELAEAADRCDVQLDTTYLGGGTPSMLRTAELERLLGSVDRRVGGTGSEVTLEIHPSTANPAKLAEWRALGVTRFSIGVESTDDSVLATLGRRHRARDALELVDAALGLDGAVVSVDLMVAVPGQDVDAELTRIVELGTPHVSTYTLTIEPGTPFARDGVAVDPDVEAHAFDRCAEVLSSAGLQRYEVSNHARPGSECRHNRAYWCSDWWLGLGPSASAHEPGRGDAIAVRRVNPHLDRWLAGIDPEIDERDGDGWAFAALVAGLRIAEGVDLAAVGRRAGIDAAARWNDGVDQLVDEGLVEVAGTTVRATAAGVRVLDRVTGAFA